MFHTIRQLRKRRGANAIEFGLTLPVFVLITFAMFEYGWMFTKMATVQGALGVACREASLVDPLDPPDGSGMGSCTGEGCVTTRAAMILLERINGPSLSCLDCSATVQGAVPAKTVRCRAHVEYTPVSGMLPMTHEVDLSTQVRLEWQRP